MMSMKKRVVFDVVLLVIFALSALPTITGIPAHEWISLVAVVVMVAHCARRGMLGEGGKSRGVSGIRIARIALNVLIGLSLAACAVSGIMVSGTVLPSFGLFATGYYFWDPFHAFSAKMLLAFLLIHVVLNARVMFVLARKMKAGRATNAAAVSKVDHG